MAISSSSLPRTARLYTAKRRVARLHEQRSRGLAPGDDEKTKKALKEAEQEQEKLRFRLNVKGMFLILTVVTVVLAIARAYPEKMSLKSLLWLLQIPEVPQNAGDYMTLLTPLIAIAVAIERLLETAFNWFEQSTRAVADVLIAPRETLDWIGREYQDAYDAAEEAVATVGIETAPESMEILDMAEERLAKAEERLRGWTQSPEYLAWKKAISIWCSLLIGLVVAILGDLGMLRYIGVPVPRIIDMFVTGLMLGSGSGPTHDLIGILQNSRNAIGSLSNLTKGNSAIQEQINTLRKAITPDTTDVS